MEILFKAKRADEKGWVIFNSFLTTKFSGAIFTTNSPIIYDGKFPIIFDVEIIPETVCQFTGRQIEDVNLFRGDKIKSFHFREHQSNHYLEHVILWNNEYSCWMASSDGTTEIKAGNVFLYIFLKKAIEPKIIGNIYDDGK